MAYAASPGISQVSEKAANVTSTIRGIAMAIRLITN
jgi:hypothetical protein